MERKPAQRFQDLEVWQKAHALVLAIYQLTAGYPKHEVFGLSSQMRRAAISVPANIAEGFKKKTPADKARILNIAAASLEELRYYLILSTDLGYLTKRLETDAAEEVARMLSTYSRTILNSTS